MKLFFYLFSFILLFISLVQTNLAYAGDCDFKRRFPITETRVISTGDEVPLPTVSCNVKSMAISGLLNLEATTKYLNQYHLYPAVLKGQGVGMLSIFNYYDSAVGPFFEMYFLIAASTKKITHSYQSIVELLRALQFNGGKINSDFVFFYVKVFSGNEKARAMSEQVWNISSTLANIKVSDGINPKDFELWVGGELWAKGDFHKGLWAINPLGLNYGIMTAGAFEGSSPLFSPLYGKGQTKVTLFQKTKHELVIYNNPLGQTLKNFDFSPFLLEWADGGMAAQLPPVL